MARAQAIEEFRLQLSQQLYINEDDLRHRALHFVEETRRQVVDQMENGLRLVGEF